MKIVYCPWELENLGCRVVEVSVLATETIDSTVLQCVESKNDYIVVKIESGNMKLTALMTQLGYTLAETQMSLRKPYAEWNVQADKLTSVLLSQMKVEQIESNEDLQELLLLMTDNMFSTDRIYLDPLFGPKYSAQRYRNWTVSEFEKGALLYKHYFRNQYVGFSLCKNEGENLHCLLAGNFEEYQRSGIGFWIPLIPLLYKDKHYKNYTTSISTNNYPVWQMYNRHHYTITKFDYVYIKHVKH